jgi:YjbE family integral membrane protein
MEMLGSSLFWITLGQIMMINIVLSGDNAVVIALASRSLPHKQQRMAIFFGSFGAIALRVILTFFAVLLLGLPYLKIAGSALLGWIGVKMLIPEDDEADVDGHVHLWGAIKTIIIADFVMSLDNVIGVAAAAKGNLVLLIIGLALSIPLIIYGSTLILKLMNRFPIIVTLGGGLLGWVAGEMAVTDPVVEPWVETQANWLHSVVPVVAALGVVALGKSIAVWKLAEPESVRKAAAAAAQDEPPPPGYRWVHRAWRILPDGTRDYAAFYGKSAFRFLVPVSSRLRRPRR